MDPYIRAGSAQDIPHYDCRPYNYTPEYLKARGSQNMALGAFFIGYGITAEFCYVMALIAMFTKELRRLSCYKIMAILGFYDMMAISVNSLITGYLWMIGAWYCTLPDLIYISGAFGLALWCGACMNCFVLVVNRLIDLWKPHFVNKLFGGNRTFVVLLLPFFYAVFFFMYTPPVIFNSDMTAWFFDPFVTEHEEEKFYNYPHTANNLLIVVATCFLYSLMVVVLMRMFRLKQQPGMRTVTSHQLSIIFQASAICLANLIGAVIYVYMQFFKTPKWLILLGHMSWQAGHGIPAFVYLLMNKTIQFTLRRMFCKWTIRRVEASTTYAGECLQRTRTDPLPTIYEEVIEHAGFH